LALVSQLSQLLCHVVLHKGLRNSGSEELFIVADFPKRILFNIYLLGLEIKHLLVEILL
jgi:hypothetical protein